MINFSSNEELVEALNQVKDNVFRIYVSRPSNLVNSVLHENVVCDGCQHELRGTRYKCTVCPDYDLCSRCEYDGKHNEHDMMCVRRPVPSGDWVFWHNFANASSQQRGIDYQMGPGPETARQGWPWRCRNKLWKKAWRCHQRLQRQCSRENVETAAPCPGKTNSDSLGATEPIQAPTQLCAADQREFLKNMSEAVQSMLNPFGIDVAFSLPDDLKEACEKEKPEEGTKTPPTPNQPTEKGEEPKKEALRPQAMNVDLDSTPATPDPHCPAELIVIDPDDEASPRPAPAPKVAVALEQMKRMGFNDTGGWLTALLSEHDGNIDRVLDEIQRKYHQG